MLLKKAIPLSKPMRRTEGINSGIKKRGYLRFPSSWETYPPSALDWEMWQQIPRRN